MKKTANEAKQMLDNLQNAEAELAALSLDRPSNWENMSQQDKLTYLNNVKQSLSNTDMVTDKLEESTQQQQEIVEDLGALNVNTKSSKSLFNLKRYAQLDETNNPQNNIEENEPNLNNTAGVRDYLDSFLDDLGDLKSVSDAINNAYNDIVSKYVNMHEETSDPETEVEGNSRQIVRDAVNSYFTSDDEVEKDKAASLLSRTVFPESESDGVKVKEEENIKMNIAQLVNDSNAAIKKIAKTKKVFNLSKIAQHQSLNQVIEYNSDSKTTDQFTHLPISDWHLVERNKGWGIKLRDHPNLDWEKVWRENVMDKYDPSYIERRFEVDKSVTEFNNYQLPDGQMRRVTPPEYGLTESRLEASRDDMNETRGYSPSSEGVVFNWKKANTKKKANLTPPRQQPLQNVPSAGEINGKTPNVNAVSNWRCSVCGDLAKNGIRPMKCEKCGAENAHYQEPAKTAPDAPKSNNNQQSFNVPVQASQDILDDGIFWNSKEKKFIIADSKSKKKKKFDSYYEAEKFKALSSEEPQETFADEMSEEERRKKEIAQHADELGIDG